MPKRQLWLIEAIEPKDEDSTVMQITVELRGGDITEKVRDIWREHALINYVSKRADGPPSLATILVPSGARTPVATDALIDELERMIPR